MNQYFRLQIGLENNTFLHIYVEDEIADAAFREWATWCNDVARAEHQLLVVHGITNDLERAEHTISVKMESVTLVEKTGYLIATKGPTDE